MLEWKDVKGWNGKYQVSNNGQLKSIGGKFKKTFPNGYVTLGTIDSLGYRMVTLRRPGIIEKNRIHRLVAECFVETKEGCNYVNHIDGNKLNNHYSNLEWCTLADNIKHAVRIGIVDKKGEKHMNAKLKEADVLKIRDLYKSGLTHLEISKMYTVSRRQIGDVINGVNWGWLK